MADPFEQQLIQGYLDAQNAPVGQRLASFQSAVPPVQPVAPPAGSAASAAKAAAVNQAFAPYQPQAPSFAPKPAGVAIPEVTVAPRPGLPGTIPGMGGGMPGRPRGSASKAILDSAIRQAALGGGQTPEEQFNAEFAQQMGEEAPPAFQPGREGTLTPHKVGLTVKPMLPGEEQQLNEAEDEAFAAQREQGEAQIKSAEEVADELVKVADQQEAIDTKFAEREMERQSMLRDRESSFQEMADEIANQPIETPSMWGDSTGENILNRIAVFLGSFSGGPNLAYEKLQKDVDRNIAMQKEKREVKAGRLKNEAMLIDMARERFKSEGAVDAVMRESAYRKVGAELERFKEFAKTPERKAALDGMIAQNNAQLTDLAIKRRQAMDADVLNERAIKARAMAGGVVDPRKKLAAKLKTEVEIKKSTDELTGKPAGEDAKAVRKAQADYDATVASIKRYEQSNVGVGITSSKADKERAEQEQQSAARTYQKEFLGASENDAKSAEQAFPAGGTFTRKESVQAAAQAALQRAKDKRDAAIKAAGGTVPGFTPQGGK